MNAYRGAIRRRWVVVVLVSLTAVALCAAWLKLKPVEYQATAQILVTPIPATDEAFTGVGLIRDAGDPTRTLETAASLVESAGAYEATARRLGANWSREDVERSVSVAPEGQSNIIDVTATGDSSAEAARLANEFASSSLELRKRVAVRQAATRLRALREQLLTLPPDSRAATETADRIPQLEALRSGQDPTLQIAQAALPPRDPAGPSRPLVVVLAILGGLVVGVGAALALDNVGRRGATEEELLWSYPRPVLARIQRLRRLPFASSTFSPLEPPAQALEAYRSLLAQLDPGDQESTLITSASRSDGKTSVAVGLALVAASAGHRVVLLDFDLRRPGIGQILDVPEEQRHSIEALGTDEPLAELLAENSRLPLLKVLALRRETDAVPAFEVLLRWLPHRLAEARELGDLVIVDAPPLGEVSDALRIATEAENVLVVIRPGRTELGAFRTMRDLLERMHRPASGFVVIGDTGRTNGYAVRESGSSEFVNSRSD